MKVLWQSLRMTLLIMFLTGIIFPLVVTVAANVLFPSKAAGSLIVDKQGQVKGSLLIAQNFSDPKYFHPRPSAINYDGSNSGGTNLGPSSKKLFQGMADDLSTEKTDESFDGIAQLSKKYREENGIPASTNIPLDAVTRSASGLDPHISLENALLQAKRVASVRSIPLSDLEKQIKNQKIGKFLGIFGDEIVNVLELNLALDQLS